MSRIDIVPEIAVAARPRAGGRRTDQRIRRVRGGQERPRPARLRVIVVVFDDGLGGFLVRGRGLFRRALASAAGAGVDRIGDARCGVVSGGTLNYAEHALDTSTSSGVGDLLLFVVLADGAELTDVEPRGR